MLIFACTAPRAVSVGPLAHLSDRHGRTLMRLFCPKYRRTHAYVNVWTVFQADIDAALELCHSGNEPSAELWHEEVEAVRLGGEGMPPRCRRHGFCVCLFQPSVPRSHAVELGGAGTYIRLPR